MLKMLMQQFWGAQVISLEIDPQEVTRYCDMQGGPMNQIVALLCIFILGFGTFPAKADDKEKCQFKLDCSVNGEDFSIEFKSPSQDCTADDMEVFLNANGNTKKLDIKPDWYFYTSHISKTQSSVCKSPSQSDPFAAYSVGKNKVLFFVKASGRPDFDNVMAILLDPSSQKVLDTKVLGSSRNHFIAVLKTKRGFKTRVVRDSLSFHKEVTCDCDAPFVDDWMEVTVTKNKINAVWMVK
jgi:hypothetical protein